jgi:hypothetical protein
MGALRYGVQPDHYVGWTEEPLAGPRRVRVRGYGTGAFDRFLAADPERDAAELSLAPEFWRVIPEPSTTGLIAAWSEATPAGGRAVQVWVGDASVGSPQPPGHPGTAGSPAVACCNWRSGPEPWTVWVAWLERGGAAAQLSAAALDLSGSSPVWIPISSSLNVDPAAAAEQPVASGPYLAWIEGGALWLRTWDESTEAFGPPRRIGGDGARWPRFLGNHSGNARGLTWVEPGPAGDVVGLALDLSGWERLPDVNVDQGGVVTSLAALDWMITWTDASGAVFAHEYNLIP